MSIKILLADDSITIQKVIGIIFGGEDYSLTVVDNGKAALEKAAEVDPDILLIDALMPGMSGYEVCEKIRATPQLAAKPILLLTGSFEPFDETKAKNCGADDFIAKPFESQQIIAKVTELCERAALLCERAALRSSDVAEMFEVEAEAPVSVTPDISPLETAPETVIASDAIWNAFTPLEPPAEVPIQPLAGLDSVSFSPQTPEPAESPWVPIDEQSFQFEEESAAAMPATTIYEQPQTDDVAFGDSPFSEPAAPTVVPHEKLEILDIPPVISSEEPEIVTAPQAVRLTEEQLKEAISAASKDVIERIVWEVVPDLAEAMIKEAIRRITENQP